MGIGRLDGSKFDLVLSVRHDASSAELQDWQTSFQKASELLYDATDGQHQLGNVYVANDSAGGSSADYWLLEQFEGGANAGGYAVLGDDGVHVTLHGEDKYRPFIVVHEHVHHAYGPGDEYKDEDGNTSGVECIGGSSASACIMEAAWSDGDRFGSDGEGGSFVDGRVSELCVSSNHDPDDDTYQDDRYDESCWETIEGEFGGLSIPSGTPTDPEPGSADTINWVELENEERFVLVIDRSTSMSGNKLTEAKYGADWWAEQALDGEHLGVVSYATTASTPPDYPLQEITGDSDRNSAKGAISGITSGGVTAIGDGLRTALDEIKDAGDQAATQIAVLLTDGRHNQGEDPSAVLPDLVDYGVRVYTIGIGKSINSSLLQNIASTTGGQFFRIDPSLPQSDQEFKIRERLQEISGEARNGGGVVTSIPERVGGEAREPGEPSSDEGGEPKEPISRNNVEIEAGSDLATFAISWKRTEAVLRLEAESPSGEVYASGSVSAGARELGGQLPWHGYHVHDPEAGSWSLRIYAEAAELPIEVTTLAFSRNRAIGGGLFGRNKISRGGVLNPKLKAYYYNPVTNLDIDGYVQRPGGAREEIEFEFGDEVGCGAGIAKTSYDKTQTPGFYTISATVSASDAREVAEGEKLVGDEDIEPEPVPDFQRTFTQTVQVGEEPRTDIELNPPTGVVGDELSITLVGTNTHFYDGGTQVSFGPGISVNEVEVDDFERLTAVVRIHEEADIGNRTVVASTPRYDEHIEIEAGFEVTADDRIDYSEIGPIGMLRYDVTGQLTGIQLEDSDDVVEVQQTSADLLTSAKKCGNEVRLRLDEESGEVEGFDIF